MRDILEISTPSHRNELCQGIGRLLDSEDDVGSDFKFSWADSEPIKAHFFVLQIFCRALPNSNCRRICFESSDIQRKDVRCLLEFVYRGKTQVEVKRLDAVKRAAVKLGLETFLDLVKGIEVKSVEEEVTIENETDTELSMEEVCESLEEYEDKVVREDFISVDRDNTECSKGEEPKSNVGKDGENGDIGNHLRFENRRGYLNAHLPTKHRMDSNGQVFEKIMKCDQCEYSCATEILLKIHIKNAHCATDKDKLKRRKRSIDSNASDYECETCAKYFKTAKSLREHKMRTLGHSEKVDCEMCGKKFALNSIQQHRKSHEVGGDKKFKCTICAYRSRDRFNLKVHLKNIHDMSERVIARLVFSEATRVSDEDLGKTRRSFKGWKKSQPKH